MIPSFTDQTINRECAECGTKNLKGRLEAEQAQYKSEVKFEMWEKTTELYQGREVLKTALCEKQLPFTDFVDVLCEKVKPHALHKIRAQWQHQMFEQSIKTLKPGEVVMMDFVENNTCRLQSEIQQYHWAQSQVTIHPIMLCYLKPCEDGHELTKEGLVIISPNLRHDALKVNRFEHVAMNHLREKGVARALMMGWEVPSSIVQQRLYSKRVKKSQMQRICLSSAIKNW